MVGVCVDVDVGVRLHTSTNTIYPPLTPLTYLRKSITPSTHPLTLLTSYHLPTLSRTSIRLGGAGIDGSLGRFDASLTSDNPRLRKALRRRAMRDGHAGGMVCRGRVVMTTVEAAAMFVPPPPPLHNGHCKPSCH